MRINNLWIAAFVYASTLILVTQGFVHMYKTTHVPNFSIGVFMTLGAYVVYTSTKIIGLPLYLGVLFAFIAGAIVSLVISVVLIEPMIRRNRTLVHMTIVTIAIGMVLENIIRVIITNYKRLFDGGQMFHLHLRQFDFTIGELSGVFLVSNIVVLASIVFLRHLSKKTVFGLSSRAIEENYELAQVQRINPKRNRSALDAGRWNG